MAPSDTPNGAAGEGGLTTSQSDYIEWVLEQGEWWML
jgi:hypothetical protein